MHEQLLFWRHSTAVPVGRSSISKSFCSAIMTCSQLQNMTCSFKQEIPGNVQLFLAASSLVFSLVQTSQRPRASRTSCEFLSKRSSAWPRAWTFLLRAMAFVESRSLCSVLWPIWSPSTNLVGFPALLPSTGAHIAKRNSISFSIATVGYSAVRLFDMFRVLFSLGSLLRRSRWIC